LIAWSADVFAPESTRALIVGIPKAGKEHHSSLPTITFSCNIAIQLNGLLLSQMYILVSEIETDKNSNIKPVMLLKYDGFVNLF
jgi:hypothetical protein